MEFKELIEARRSVRKYVASEISKADVEEIVGETASEAGRRGREGFVMVRHQNCFGQADWR